MPSRLFILLTEQHFSKLPLGNDILLWVPFRRVSEKHLNWHVLLIQKITVDQAFISWVILLKQISIKATTVIYRYDVFVLFIYKKNNCKSFIPFSHISWSKGLNCLKLHVWKHYIIVRVTKRSWYRIKYQSINGRLIVLKNFWKIAPTRGTSREHSWE